jgi:hypothetical protein
MSSTVDFLRNCSVVRCSSPSGVSVVWKAWRWSANVSPGLPKAFLLEVDRVGHAVEHEDVVDHDGLPPATPWAAR